MEMSLAVCSVPNATKEFVRNRTDLGLAFQYGAMVVRCKVWAKPVQTARPTKHFPLGDHMQNVLVSTYVNSARSAGIDHVPDAYIRTRKDGLEPGHDRLFFAMLDSYRRSGGVAAEKEMSVLFKSHYGAEALTLTNWISEREVFCFEWQSKMWFPLFQFNRFDMTPQAGLGQVLAELTSVYDSWELAIWFARPNPWLADHAPVDKLVSDLAAVLHAARADRFVAKG